MTAVLPHFIGGERRTSSGKTVREHANPSRLDDIVSRVAVGSADDVNAAVDAAANAFPKWRATTGPARAELLYKWSEIIAGRADEIAKLIVREVGKPIGEARGEVGRAAVILRYYAGEAVRDIGEVIPAQAADALQFTLRDPLGVVGLITPWNFPLAIPLWKAAPALAFGNTVVLKPSELSSSVALVLAESAQQAGIPAGVFNVVHGDGTTGEALVRHQRINAVSFTGSQAVGGRVSAIGAERQVRVQTEMGGKNVVIVARDGDLARAANLTAAGAMRYAGQKCTATSRVIVDKAIEAEFLQKLRTAIEALPIGPSDDPAGAIGPLITAASKSRIEAALAECSTESLFEAAMPRTDHFANGNWFAPRVLRFPDTKHPLAQRELFGPVLGIMSASNLDEAIEMANETLFGLSASLFTTNLRTALHYVRQIEVGLVRVNGDTTGVDPHAPFGGTKQSSAGGREQGRAARDFYTEIRTVQIHS